jgi:quercetin dioxygenase-like cupin family protein
LRLTLRHHPEGAAVEGPNRIVYDLEAAEAHIAPVELSSPALVWELADGDAPDGALLSAEVELDSATSWLMRCDRVDFGPGGIAYRHTHPGPGIRYLLFGEITIDSEGAEHTYSPGEPWFERGPDPVLATTTDREPSAFARVLLLPVEFAGKRTISYVDPADAEKPKTQRAQIFSEHPVLR